MCCLVLMLFPQLKYFMESRDAVYDTVCIVTEIVHGSTLCKLDMKAHCGSSSCRMLVAMEGQG